MTSRNQTKRQPHLVSIVTCQAHYMPLHFGVRSCLLSLRPFSHSSTLTTHLSMGDAASADASAGTLRHKTLSVYYPVLTTLGAHLAATPTLRYGSSDPGDYLDLLSTTICAPNAQAGTAPPPEPVHCTQQEAIDRIVQELVATKGPRGDALVWGTKVPSSVTHLYSCGRT